MKDVVFAGLIAVMLFALGCLAGCDFARFQMCKQMGYTTNGKVVDGKVTCTTQTVLVATPGVTK